MTNRRMFSRRNARPRHAIQRVKKTPLSTIASRLNRRWDRLSARSCSANTSPGFTEPVIGPATLGRTRWFNPGYEIQINKKEAERRQAHVFRWSAPQTSLRSLRKPSASGAARALTRRARLTAFHRGTCCSEPTPQLSSRTRFLGRGILQALPEGDLSQSSDKVADRSSCRPGVFPLAARERR